MALFTWRFFFGLKTMQRVRAVLMSLRKVGGRGKKIQSVSFVLLQKSAACNTTAKQQNSGFVKLNG